MAKAGEPEKLKIFISYSRRDSTEADALVEALKARGFGVTIDRRDLPFGEKWQAELAEFIRLSDTVVWLVSEASIQSKWVNWELDEVAKRNKRLVPVMIAEVDRGALPRQLGEIHILPADRAFDLSHDLQPLVQVLETDRAWLKQASRLQDRASEWLSKNRAGSLLLSRGALEEAEQWKNRRPAKAPAPAQEVLDLLLASRQSIMRRQKWTLAASLIFSLFAITVAGFAFYQRSQAVAERNAALASNSRVLARQSQELLERKNPVKAILTALEALPSQPGERPYVWQAERAAYAALFKSERVKRIASIPRQKGWGDWRPILSHDGQVVFGEIEFPIKENSAAIWSTRDGSEIARFVAGVEESRVATIDDTRKHVFVRPSGQPAQLIELATMERKTLSESSKTIVSQFSRSGERLATLHADGKVRLWNVADGSLLRAFESNATPKSSILFSDDGQKIAVSPNDREILVFDGEKDEPLCRLDLGEGQSAGHWFFTASDSVMITANVHTPMFKISGDPTARFWDLSSCQSWTLDAGKGKNVISAIHQLASPDRVVVSWDDGFLIVLDPKSKSILYKADAVPDYAVTKDNLVMLHDAESRPQIVTPTGTRADLQMGEGVDDLYGVTTRRSKLESIQFNRQGSRLVAAIGVLGTPQIWDTATGQRLGSLQLEGVRAQPLTFSPDGKLLVAVDKNGRFQIWDADKGEMKDILDVGSTDVTAEFSGDGRTLTVRSADRSTIIFDFQAHERLEGGENLISADFIDNGSRVLGGSSAADYVWDATTGKRLALPPEELARLSEERFAAKERSGVPFEVIARSGAEARNVNKIDVQQKGGGEELLASDITDQALAEIESKETAAAAKKFGTSDLVFLTLVGPKQEPWQWIVGNDGRISTRPATVSHEKSRVMNGRSLSHELISIPQSHQPLFGTKVHDIAFSPDGMSMLLNAEMADFDGMRLYRLAEQETVQVIAEQASVEGDALLEALFMPSTNRIVVSSQSSLRVLDGETLNPVAVIPLSSRALVTFDVSPDGRRILTLQDGEVRLWDLQPDTVSLIEHARKSAARCLTLSERVNELQLDSAPPLWCVERRLWPYNTDAWQEWLPKRQAWLAANRRGAEPKLPKD